MRRIEILALLAACPAALAAARLIAPGLQFLLVEGLVLFLMAQMWNLAAGYAGQVSLGQQLFVGAGAYTLFAIANGTALPVWAVLALVPLLVGLAAIPLGLVMFPLKHAYFAIGMWVLAEIAQQLVLKTPALGGTGGLTLRPNGQAMTGYPEQIVLALCVIGSVALVVGLRVFLRRPMGLATLAMRDNPAAAQGAGVDIRRLHLILFVLTAAGTALAGALYYTTMLYTSPLAAFQVSWIVSTLVIVVIGGIGTLTGPAIGTLLLITLREVMTAQGFSGDAFWIVMGALSIVTLLFLPRGLWPALHDRFSRRKAAP
jgi:branched-chain amino acid transport system permease protein